MTTVITETYCLGIGVAQWARRELPLFFQTYLVLCGILFNFIAIILLVWA